MLVVLKFVDIEKVPASKMIWNKWFTWKSVTSCSAEMQFPAVVIGSSYVPSPKKLVPVRFRVSEVGSGSVPGIKHWEPGICLREPGTRRFPHNSKLHRPERQLSKLIPTMVDFYFSKKSTILGINRGRHESDAISTCYDRRIQVEGFIRRVEFVYFL